MIDIWIDANGAWRVDRTAGAATQTSKSADGAAVLGQTYHIVVVFPDGANHALYVNGAAVALTHTGAAIAAAMGVASTDEIAIGAPTPASLPGMAGKIGRVTLWPFAMSATRDAVSYRHQADAARWIGIGGEDLAGESNHAPVAVPFRYTANPNVAKTINVRARAYDPDGDIPSIVAGSLVPSVGTANIVGGDIVATPPASAADGSEQTVQFTLQDPAGKRSTAKVYGTVRVAAVGGRIHQPFHRPTALSDITYWPYDPNGSPPVGDWSTYLMIGWPDTPVTKTFNIAGRKYKGIIEIGGVSGPKGDTSLTVDDGGNPPTSLGPAIKGYGGILERSFAVDVPTEMRTATGRPYWWCDGLLVDTCYDGGSPGVNQDMWWGDIFKTGIAGNQTAANVNRYSDAIILRTDIANGAYFFDNYTGAAGGGQASHSDIMQNEGRGLRSLSIWKFHSRWHGQGFYLNGAGGGTTAKYLPRDAMFEAIKVHMEPMPWEPVMTHAGIKNRPAKGYKPWTSSDADSVNPDTVAHGVVSAGQYYAHFIGDEVYLQNTCTYVTGCAGEAGIIVGLSEFSNSNRSLDSAAKKLTLSIDKRAKDADKHDYAYVGNTGGGMWNRPEGTYKNWVYTKAPSSAVVTASEVGFGRRLNQTGLTVAQIKQGLIDYFNNGT